MATHDYAIADAAGATARADINNVLSAIVSQNSNATAPSPTFAYQLWYDTTANALKMRNAANSVWLTLATFDQTGGLIRWDFDKGADIASAATTDIGAATGNYVVVTGTTGITALGTIKAGTHRWVRFSGILTLTHNGTSLILPGGASITTAAGDMMLALSEGSGNWRVAFYQKADGTAVVPQVLPALAEYFESAEQALGAGTTTIAHGLSGAPALIHFVLRCKTTEHGYAVGDEVKMSDYVGEAGSGSFVRNAAIAGDATNVRLTQAAAISIMSTASAFVTATVANWRFVVRAWR